MSREQQYSALANRVAELWGGKWDGKEFTSGSSITPSVPQRFEVRITQSSELFSSGIAVTKGHTQIHGQTIGLYSAQTVAGRTNTDNAERKTSNILGRSSRTFTCKDTHYDTHIKYLDLDLWANDPDFQSKYTSIVAKEIAKNRELICWYGEKAEENTDRSLNPLLQDVNVGWLQDLRDNNAARFLGLSNSKIKFGEGAGSDGFESLEIAILHLKYLLDPVFQNSPDLVVLVGSEMAKSWEINLHNVNKDAMNKLALNELIGLGRCSGLPLFRSSFIPARSIIVTVKGNLAYYYQTGSRRRTLVDRAASSRYEDFNSCNETPVVEDYRAISGVDFKHVLLKQPNGEWQ